VSRGGSRPGAGRSPQPGPQSHLIKCPVDEIFFGGARGGGKTDGMLGKFAVKAAKYGEHCVGARAEMLDRRIAAYQAG
jgi:hypothetical protein